MGERFPVSPGPDPAPAPGRDGTPDTLQQVWDSIKILRSGERRQSEWQQPYGMLVGLPELLAETRDGLLKELKRRAATWKAPVPPPQT